MVPRTKQTIKCFFVLSAKSHLKKAIIMEHTAQKIARDDRFVTRLKSVQKVTD